MASNRFFKASLLLWAILVVFLVMQAWIFAPYGTVFNVYYVTANHWLQHQNLYFSGFIYLPFSALVHTAFAVLPFNIALGLYRLLLILLLMFSSYKLLDLFNTNRQKIFFLLTILFILISYATMATGQLNVLLVVTYMASMFLLYNKNWHACGFLLAIGFGIKPTILPLMLVIMVLYPATIISTVLGLLFVILLPFAFSGQHYVVAQYMGLYSYLTELGQHTAINTSRWSQIFNVLSQVNINLDYKIQKLIMLVAGVVSLLLAWLAKKKFNNSNYSLLLIMTILAAYLMLFNLRNEGNSFIIFVPALVFAISMAQIHGHKYFLGFFILAAIGIFGNYYFSGIIPGQTCWFSPFMTSLFVIFGMPYLFNSKVAEKAVIKRKAA